MFLTSETHVLTHLEAVETLLEELHEGICGSHTGGRLWPIELLPKDIGGRACKELLRIM